MTLLSKFSSYVSTGDSVFYFGPGGLRAPSVLACAMRSLAIVFINFRSFFLSLSLRLLLLTHFEESPMCEILFMFLSGIDSNISFGGSNHFNLVKGLLQYISQVC